MEALLAEELAEIVSRMKTAVLENQGKYTIDSKKFALSQINVIWCLITGGDRFSHDDVKLKAFLETLEKFNGAVALNQITLPFPIIGTLFPSWSGWKRYLDVIKEMYLFTEVRSI